MPKFVNKLRIVEYDGKIVFTFKMHLKYAKNEYLLRKRLKKLAEHFAELEDITGAVPYVEMSFCEDDLITSMVTVKITFNKTKPNNVKN